MKRVLIPTSKRLEGFLKGMEVDEGYEVEVWGLPIDVVALLRPRSLEALLKKESERRGVPLSSFDIILVSGMIPGDLSELSEKLGTKVVKGTRTLSELKVLLKNLGKLENLLSPSRPLEEELKKFLLLEVAKSMKSDFQAAFEIDGLKFPMRGPPALLGAEIMEGEKLEEKLLKASEVADFVIIGSSSISPDPSKVPSLVKLAEKYFKVVAFDSMFAEELNEACSSGAQIALSLDESKAEKVECEAAVVIPGNSEKGYWPLTWKEKVESLKNNLEKVKKVDKLFVDPVLSPPWNTLESLIAFKKVSEELEYPIFMGLSNVVELMDVDTPGSIGLLTFLATEIGVSAVMVTEQSPKCLNAWYEAKVAIAMATSSKPSSALPKDLGIDLLILKEKRVERLKFEEEGERVEVKDYDFPLEDSIVRIWVDEGVKVLVERRGKKYVLEGHPYMIGKTLIAKGLVKSPSHALYLGWELQKAYLANKLDKSYVQEQELKFESAKEKWRELRSALKEVEGMSTPSKQGNG